jgi:hypothetical protein
MASALSAPKRLILLPLTVVKVIWLSFTSLATAEP